MQTVEMTSDVLKRIKHQKLSETPTGSSSSILRANGFISNAYLVNGLITCIKKINSQTLQSTIHVKNVKLRSGHQ